MRVKTTDLIGPALNWAVAKIVGHESRCPWLLEQKGFTAWQSYEESWGNPLPDFTTWTQGGPIIERERICLTNYLDGDKEWAAYPTYDTEDIFSGPTPLIAAMRCYVASRMGDEVDVPEELMK